MTMKRVEPLGLERKLVELRQQEQRLLERQQLWLSLVLPEQPGQQL